MTGGRNMIRHLVGIALLALVLAACSTPEPQGPTTPVTLTVTPAAGPPGTLVTVTGLSVETLAGGDLALFIGGVQLPASAEEDGALTSMLPPFVGADGWHEPTGPLDVVVEHHGSEMIVVGVATDAVTITALTPAPDAHQRIVTAVSDAADAFETIALNLPTDTDEDDQIMWALSQTLREFLITGENSLDAIAAGTAPLFTDLEADLGPDLDADTGLELGGALLANAGLPEMVEALAAELAALATAMAPSVSAAQVTPQSSSLCPYATDPDEDLACKMQLYVLASRIGQELLTPIAKQFGAVTAVTGIAGIAVKIPYVSAVGFALSLAELTWNKIVVALLPATIDSFTLTFDDGPIVKQGDRIEGRLELTASNDPPALNSNDLLGVFMGLLGLSGGPIRVPGVTKLPSGQESALRAYAVKAINYFLGVLQSSFSNYAEAHPELNLTFDLVAMPEKSWGPTRIEDYNLFDAHSFTPALLPVDEETPANPAWRAPADVSGDARVNVRTATGPAARKIIRSGYEGGAFGDNARATENATICVDDAPELTQVSSVSPTVLKAEKDTQVTFRLPWSDHCGNLDRLYARYDLDGTAPVNLQYDVATSPNTAFFSGDADTGVLIDDFWVGCSEQGKDRMNAKFYLLDEFSQTSEEVTAFLIVDYGDCP